MNDSSHSVVAAATHEAPDLVPQEARRRLGPGAAQVIGWAALAIVNQLLLLTRALPTDPRVRVLHHAYDAGQLLAAGLASFALVELASRLAARFGISERARWPGALAIGLTCLGVSLGVVEPDVANAAARFGAPVWVAVLAASLTFGVLLGVVPLLAPRRARPLKALLLVMGLACGTANAFILLGDYPALHLMLAWLSALLIAAAVEGEIRRPKLNRLPESVLVGVLLLACLAAVAWPPSQAVLKRLYSLPSSVLAPFIARLYPQSGPALHLVRREYLASPWFQPRDELPAQPASGALLFPGPKTVILLTIDALRADVVTDRQYLRELPAFSAMHERCAHFSQARTAASSTRAALSTLFLGHYYSQFRSSLKEMHYKGPRLPVLVSRAGVRTASVPRVPRITVAAGVTVGFENEIRGKFGAGGLIDKLIEVWDPSRPSFLFGHIGEPHAPYKGKGTRFQRYVQEVGEVDRHLARLFAHLKEKGLDKRTLVIVTADHGEGFGEHGVFYHARIIYEEVARIPLFICGPSVVARRIDQPVSLIDLAPTILDAFGLPTPGTFMGQSLLPLAAGGTKKLARPLAIHATHGLAGFYLDDGKKVIFDMRGKTVEVYDLVKDPDEQFNLSDSTEPSIRSAIETARYFFFQHRVTLDREYPTTDEMPTVEAAFEPEEPGP